ncbi:hypothetical protein M8C21_015562 [Ambrosia artemisiifolia]|uniref:Uncharacterized protein n=1 Tax=Ambrosia artemisiifolia TaxID=4212 RepID=A0AAD5D6N6_AMBAR|nr:hypothetical protein M8C21_015562 [Ambrosia artemisiifolia]
MHHNTRALMTPRRNWKEEEKKLLLGLILEDPRLLLFPVQVLHCRTRTSYLTH